MVEPTPSEPVRLYTHALWRVRPGHEQEFMATWEELARVFSSLPRPPAGKGTLIRSVEDPLRFYSFGEWRSAEDVAAMRADLEARRAIASVESHCTEAEPGLYRVEREVVVPERPGGR